MDKVNKKTLSGKVISFLKRRLNPFNTEYNYRNLGKNAPNQSFTEYFRDTSKNYRKMGKGN
jgi:hypothetical protein